MRVSNITGPVTRAVGCSGLAACLLVTLAACLGPLPDSFPQPVSYPPVSSIDVGQGGDRKTGGAAPDRAGGSPPVDRNRAGAILTAPTGFSPPVRLSICPRAKTYLPAYHASRQIANYSPVIEVKRVPLYTVPVKTACLMRGVAPSFGRYRGGHDGLDLVHRRGAKIYAAGAGTIRQVRFQRGYGRYVLIQHSGDVLTRYAHLDRVARRIKVGQRVQAGEVLGTMGDTGRKKNGQRVGVHLHYEILVGRCRGDNCFNQGNMQPINPFGKQSG